MEWYAGSVITYFEVLGDGEQEVFEVFENVYLIQAKDDDEARRKAEEMGRASIVDDETLRVGGKPARIVFGGVRKIISVASNPSTRTNPSDSVTTIEDGVEVTYNEFLVSSRKGLVALIRGDSVEVTYGE